LRVWVTCCCQFRSIPTSSACAVTTRAWPLPAVLRSSSQTHQRCAAAAAPAEASDLV
jgi:hypothetical protein